MGEQREEALVGSTDIGWTHVHPVATQRLHVDLLQWVRPNQEGHMVDQAKIIGTGYRVLAGAWKSQSGHVQPLHGSCVPHRAIQGRHLLKAGQDGTNDVEDSRLGAGSCSHTPGQYKEEEKNQHACFRSHRLLLSASLVERECCVRCTAEFRP